MGDDIENAPPVFKQLYSAYRQTITDLYSEKEKLKNELNKKQYINKHTFNFYVVDYCL